MNYKILSYKKAVSVLKKVPFNINPDHLKSTRYMINTSGKIYWPGNRFNLKVPHKTAIGDSTESCKRWALKHNLYQQTFLRSIIESTLPTAELRKPEFAEQKQNAIDSLTGYIKGVCNECVIPPSKNGEKKSFVKDLCTIFSTIDQEAVLEVFKQELSGSSMLDGDEILLSLQKLEERPTKESLKMALSIENPYAGKSSNIKDILQLFDLYST